METNQLHRIRRGWFASSSALSQVVRAVEAGGVLTGPSALHCRGAWLPPDLPLFVRASRTDLIRKGPQITPVVLRREFARGADKSVDDLALATLTTLLECSVTTAVILIDSLLHRQLMSRVDIEEIVQTVGNKGEEALRLVSSYSESGTESQFRLWLRSKGIRYREQARIEGVGRVDFLIGNRLIVEIDSREHHTSDEAYRNDRRRDRKLAAMGFICVRLTYAEVMYFLDEVGQDLLAIIRRDDHRRIPSALRHLPVMG